MKVLVLDFEVFRYDTLLGVYDVNNGKYIQTWDPKEIRRLYLDNANAVWVGHNNSHYDNYISQAVVMGDDPYRTSKTIISGERPPRLSIPLEYYDTMSRHFASLKVLEAYMGKNISESEIDFNIDRPLTAEEKAKTESYNRDDLDQTFLNLKLVKKEFQLRLDLIKEFNLSLSVLHMTEAQIAAAVLGAKRIECIESAELKPVEYPNLIVRNEEAKRFYLSESWSWKNQGRKPSIEITLCGLPHTIAAGGIHAGTIAHEPFAYYLDVSGYYNLVMINYDLLPRSIPEEGKLLYKKMYADQLALKKKDPVKRSVYKTILLAVFGAMNNKYCDFYDPYKGDLVRLTGEMFLVDLLEKLEPCAYVIQSNTDGIMIKPKEGVSESDIRAITDEWQKRTGFVLKFEKIYDIIQRDVNNYMYKDDQGKIHVKGEALKHWECPASPFECNSYDAKEPLIISKCIVEYFMNGKEPEQTVKECESDIRLFQFICKKGTYDHLEWDDGRETVRLQKVNRCFAGRRGFGTIYKCKGQTRVRYPSIPTGVFVHNGAIDIKLRPLIDYGYYVRRAKERIDEFRLRPKQLSLF